MTARVITFPVQRAAPPRWLNPRDPDGSRAIAALVERDADHPVRLCLQCPVPAGTCFDACDLVREGLGRRGIRVP